MSRRRDLASLRLQLLVLAWALRLACGLAFVLGEVALAWLFSTIASALLADRAAGKERGR